MSDHPQIKHPGVGQYPGLGLDLRYHDQNEGRDRGDIFPIGIHPNCFGADSDMLLIREVAMMIIMDRLTDKPDWHVKVFDDNVAAKWTEEALAIPVESLYTDIVEYERGGPKRLKTILDRGCLEYCIKELRAKARFFEKTSLIPTLDATATVVKSDNLIDCALHDELRAVFAKLKDDQKDDPDWHPRTNEMVRNLVHPSLYSLVYGRSRVFQDEVVGVEDAIDRWAGKGAIIPQSGPDIPVSRGYSNSWDTHLHGLGIGDRRVHDSFWSNKYQWLPSNIRVQDDGSVRFTSYINGLHPNKYRDIYGTIEKLIEKALPAWDFCLPLRRHARRADVAGRNKPRFPPPGDPDDENENNWTPSIDEVPNPSRSGVREAKATGPTSNPAAFDEAENERHVRVESEDEDGYRYYGSPREVAWNKIRQPVQPEAPEFRAWDYGVKPGETLRERFKDLQVIVKMASIELTPEKPCFPAGGWHVEGQMNEHIVATALYYLDSENITPSRLDFRMQTSYDQDASWEVGQGRYEWMERVYGTRLGSGSNDTSCLQRYGNVQTTQGRLLAFPNVFHHRVSPFELEDKTKPGHRRFIALWLVDPLTRIINTGNVPPQQKSWWMEYAFKNLGHENAKNVPQPVAQLILDSGPGHPGLKAAVECGERLPVELVEMVQQNAGDEAMPMSLEEAKEHRLKLMEERTSFQDEVRNRWKLVEYSFCEH
ncbi:hypothetical protein FALBO_493 [Fusarium albosuccineum]|uniref:Uncharacterized protein n=1 Tax=Fusarium albosuccineum TaxID=1237068 RepID=A0A8H4LQB1_9HYPO|nr:hypothetical protein FALBO_493 [Fusarium albosuccineum]